MKKQLLLALLAIAFTGNAIAQKAPNALTKLALLKLQSAGIANDKVAKAYPIFFEYYSMKQKVTTAVAAGENKVVPTEEFAKLISNRDENLGLLLSTVEMKNFKKKLEAELIVEENK